MCAWVFLKLSPEGRDDEVAGHGAAVLPSLSTSTLLFMVAHCDRVWVGEVLMRDENMERRGRA